MSRDTGYKSLQRERDVCFLKWGAYMKRSQIAEMKLKKLRALLLLADPSVSGFEMNELTTRQWMEFIKCFPDEARTQNEKR